MYHGLHFGLLHTSNLFPIKINSAGGLECLMLQIDASDKNFFSDYFFIELVRHICLPRPPRKTHQSTIQEIIL